MNPLDDAINLGQTPEDAMPGETSPVMGGPTPDKPPEPSYPQLSITDHPDQGLMQMPEQGHAIIKYRIHSREASHHPRSKKKRYSVRMHVHSIKPHKMAGKKRSKPLPGPEADEKAVDEGLM